MKYFTPTTLTIFALNSLLLTVSASHTEKPKEPNSDVNHTEHINQAEHAEIVTHPHSEPAPSPASSPAHSHSESWTLNLSFLDSTRRGMDQVYHAVKGVFVTPEGLIQDHLQLPTPLDPNTIVQVNPTEAVCHIQSPSEFWTALFAADGRVEVEKIIFCPHAVSFLKELDLGKLLKNAKDQKLKNILIALMLRRVTLIGKYSSLYIDENYLNCFNSLWDQVHSQKGSEFWPCTATQCDPQTIKDNFKTFVDKTPACKNVLEDQLALYAEKVAKAAVAHNITVPSVLREAILDNLTTAPHLSLPFSNLYDMVMESDKTAAAARIESVLKDVKGSLEEQFGASNTIYADAEHCANHQLALRPDKSTVSTPTKTVKLVVEGPTKTEPEHHEHDHHEHGHEPEHHEHDHHEPEHHDHKLAHDHHEPEHHDHKLTHDHHEHKLAHSTATTHPDSDQTHLIEDSHLHNKGSN